MFLGEKVISLETLISRLGLSEETINVGNFVLRKDYENSMLETVLARDRIRQLESDLQSLRFNMLMSKNKLEEHVKERLQEKHVERILGSILQNFDTDLKMDDENPWIVEIQNINYDGLNFLIDLSEKIDNDLRGRLGKRLKASEYSDQVMLDDVLLRKRHKITLAEKLENHQLTRAQARVWRAQHLKP
jgi:hypothetical protein